MPLRDWNPFARRAGSEAREPPALAAALADLGRLTSARPELAPAGMSLGRVLRAAFLAPAPEPHFDADPELVLDAWRAGVPAFRAGDVPPPLDSDDLRARALAVLDALDADNPRAAPLGDALRAGRADLHAWAADALVARTDALDGVCAASGLDAALARSVLRLSLLPVLAPLAGALDALRPEGLWGRGECPGCGGPAALGESRGLEQRRRWRCGVCAADWAGDRLRCPFCGETDHRRLSYRFAEDRPDAERLCVCETCGGRLAVVATLTPLSAPGLLVAELAAVHLGLADDGGT